MEINRLQVILKSVERCNIACTYCYYFFGGDESYKDRPPVVSLGTIQEIANFLAQGCKDIKINYVQIVFHGGEPLLQRKDDFSFSCQVLKKSLSHLTNVFFSVQTNGMLIDEEWIKLFCEHDCIVSVSLDGTKIENDMYRIDKLGRGTYDRVAKGLKLLVEARLSGLLKQEPALLTVVNYKYDYKKIIKHFIDDLGVTWIGILLPDRSHDNEFNSDENAVQYGDILIDLFDLQLEYGVERVTIRPINEIFDFFQDKRFIPRSEPWHDITIGNQIVVLQSNGDISVDDSFMPALDWRKEQKTYSISETSLIDYLQLPIFHEIRVAYQTLPKKCQDCAWKEICRGGDLENRYKSGNGFNQESVYCDGLDKFYEYAVTQLFHMGYPKDKIVEKLQLGDI